MTIAILVLCIVAGGIISIPVINLFNSIQLARYQQVSNSKATYPRRRS